MHEDTTERSNLLTVVLGALGVHVGLHARPGMLKAWQADGDVFKLLRWPDKWQRHGNDLYLLPYWTASV